MRKLTLTKTQDSFRVATSHCEFCSEFLGYSDNAFHALYHDIVPDRSLFVSNNFRVFPSIGQIVEGYLLIAPVTHFCALDELPTILTSEISLLHDRIKQALTSCYGSCISYEHGARSSLSGGCGIYHAHLHAVPLPPSLDPINSLKSAFSYKRIEGLSQIKQHSQGMSGYIFYQDANARAYLFDTPNLPSQFMRRILANVLGEHAWDWRDAGREKRLLASLSRLSGYLDNSRFSAASTTNEPHR